MAEVRFGAGAGLGAEAERKETHSHKNLNFSPSLWAYISNFVGILPKLEEVCTTARHGMALQTSCLSRHRAFTRCMVNHTSKLVVPIELLKDLNADAWKSLAAIRALPKEDELRVTTLKNMRLTEEQFIIMQVFWKVFALQFFESPPLRFVIPNQPCNVCEYNKGRYFNDYGRCREMNETEHFVLTLNSSQIPGRSLQHQALTLGIRNKVTGAFKEIELPNIKVEMDFSFADQTPFIVPPAKMDDPVLIFHRFGKSVENFDLLTVEAINGKDFSSQKIPLQTETASSLHYIQNLQYNKNHIIVVIGKDVYHIDRQMQNKLTKIAFGADNVALHEHFMCMSNDLGLTAIHLEGPRKDERVTYPCKAAHHVLKSTRHGIFWSFFEGNQRRIVIWDPTTNQELFNRKIHTKYNQCLVSAFDDFLEFVTLGGSHIIYFSLKDGSSFTVKPNSSGKQMIFKDPNNKALLFLGDKGIVAHEAVIPASS